MASSCHCCYYNVPHFYILHLLPSSQTSSGTSSVDITTLTVLGMAGTKPGVECPILGRALSSGDNLLKPSVTRGMQMWTMVLSLCGSYLQSDSFLICTEGLDCTEVLKTMIKAQSILPEESLKLKHRKATWRMKGLFCAWWAGSLISGPVVRQNIMIGRQNGSQSSWKTEKAAGRARDKRLPL